MFCRQCVKLTSAGRVLLSKKLLSPKVLATRALHQRDRFYSSTIQNQASKPEIATIQNQASKPEIENEPKVNEIIISPSKTEELLEKMIAGLSSDIYQKNRVYKNDLMRVIVKVKDMNFSTKRQGLLLIRCCGVLLPDESPASRMVLVEQIWNTLKPHTKFSVEHYNELLRVYIANKRTLTVRSFIDQMAPSTPNITTFELILRALGECGDVNQATEVISNMKAQNLPATENVFNSLILGQGMNGNLKNIKEVRTMMQSLKIDPTIDTYTAEVRSLIWNKQNERAIEHMNEAVKSGFRFEESHIMDIVKTLAEMNLYPLIPKFLRFLPEETLKSPSISPYMQSVTTALVFENHPIPALEIYKCLPLPSFGPKDDKGLHGRSLVRDCVKASMPSSIIALVTQELMSTGRNPIALHNASEAALQLCKMPLALDLFTRMQILGMPVRPHYFWPILIHNSKSYGEKGILNTLQTMVKMDVKPDYETMMNYVIPYVSFTSPQNLMKKFTDAGLTVSTALTPMLETLLSTGQVRAASELCELFHGKVDAEKLLKPLLKGYIISCDVKSTVYLLEDISNKAEIRVNRDWVGRFLTLLIQNKKVMEDFNDFKKMVKAIHKAGLKASTVSVDYCLTHLPENPDEEEAAAFRNIFIAISDERLVDDGPMFVQQMPHPKQMNEESLKAHLNELAAKGMNTRGVLRKLLQLYCKENNLSAAREIAEKCQKEGVFLSAGMKASIFDLHVKLGELDLAEIVLADLNKQAPKFTLDEYKVIDFATLMAYRKRVGKAFELIREQSKGRRIVGGRSIEMNCWRLLDATAAHGKLGDARLMFELLTSLGYCKPNNVLLGPLIRGHLNNENLHEAVQEFSRLANLYNKTPLKHELLRKIMETIGEGRSEEYFLSNEKFNGRLNKLAQTVLNIDKKVHGPSDVQLTLISVLADIGFKKTLRKMFLDPTVKFHPDALLRRCERFAVEKRVHALEAIAECGKGLRRVDESRVYDLIMDVHQREDNYKDALALWSRMQSADIVPSQKFIMSMCSLLKANHKQIPAEIISFQDKQAKIVN